MEANLPNLMKKLDLSDNSGSELLCDFSLEEQNALSEAQGITPTTNPNFTPVLGKTVNYIVAFVLFNDDDEVLMMQEARESCKGKWYLPAGRMERGERIIEAAQREVQEETGLIVDVTTLLNVETAGGNWFRFVVTGNVIGGELKTLLQADTESLQAKFVGNIEELPLRSQDIVSLINNGRLYKNSMPMNPWPKELLPIPRAHTKNYLRVICAIKRRSTNRFQILYSERDQSHYPTVEIHPERNLYSTLMKFMKEIFGADVPKHRPQGLLSIEHSPSQIAGVSTDGICLNLLVLFRPPMEEVTIIGKYAWEELSPDASKEMEKLISAKYATLFELNVLR